MAISSCCIMLNRISATPCVKRPGVTSAVVATVVEEEVLLVDPESDGPATPSAFVPVIGGQGQWTHEDQTSATSRLIHYAESNHIFDSVCFMFVLCLCYNIENVKDQHQGESESQSIQRERKHP